MLRMKSEFDTYDPDILLDLLPHGQVTHSSFLKSEDYPHTHDSKYEFNT